MEIYEMATAIYTKEAWPIEMRRDFSLPDNPYESQEARDKLESLGVIHYRDEDHNEAIVLGVDTGSCNIKGFYHLVSLDANNDYVPLEWERQEKKEVQEYIKKKGDPFEWLHFNKPAHIFHIDSSKIVSR